MDDIWHGAGDRSTDMDWYTKRALLGGVYTATELYMLTDFSAGWTSTSLSFQQGQSLWVLSPLDNSDTWGHFTLEIEAL